MFTTELTKKELDFMSQSDIFLELFLKERGFSDISDVESITSRVPFPLNPILVHDFRKLQASERSQIVESYQKWGVAHLMVLNPDDNPISSHPMLDICEQLKDELHLHYPLQHPLEGHSEAVARFGPPDGTAKFYNLPKPLDGPTYREVATTSDVLEVHTDGGGFGGTVQTIALYLDSPALFGGFTFFYDVATLGVELAKTDMEAFRYLFLPDAITSIRPRGEGAIKITSPALYVNEDNQPQIFFRSTNGEHKAIWRKGCAPLDRACDFLYTYTTAFTPGSYFIPFTRKGQMCLSRNRDLAHGRTAYTNGQMAADQRVMSKKWFMTAEKHAVQKNVPGTAVRADFAALFPEQFGADKLVGHWLYDMQSDTNYLARQ
jgi:hypothetical protein